MKKLFKVSYYEMHSEYTSICFAEDKNQAEEILKREKPNVVSYDIEEIDITSPGLIFMLEVPYQSECQCAYQ